MYAAVYVRLQGEKPSVHPSVTARSHRTSPSVYPPNSREVFAFEELDVLSHYPYPGSQNVDVLVVVRCQIDKLRVGRHDPVSAGSGGEGIGRSVSARVAVEHEASSNRKSRQRSHPCWF